MNRAFVQEVLPVWRELKLYMVWSGPCCCCAWVQEVLPVWRELKPFFRSVLKTAYISVQEVLPVWRELKLFKSLYLFFSQCQFRKSFPFEGNWNSASLLRSKCNSMVQEVLPVWRELKPTNRIPCLKCASVQEVLPVWRELKLILLRRWLFLRYKFRKSFPFEGNWNTSWSAIWFSMVVFRKSFPFEGNVLVVSNQLSAVSLKRVFSRL